MMAMIQQSIEISVPVHTAYHRLTRCEEYPRFKLPQDMTAEEHGGVPASVAVGKHQFEDR